MLSFKPKELCVYEDSDHIIFEDTPIFKIYKNNIKTVNMKHRLFKYNKLQYQSPKICTNS